MLEKMRDAIPHRGPDGHGFHVGQHQGFLNVRLAIVDREGGSQPIYSQDGTKGIVFNGEIYNFRQLRQELEQEGVLFTTHSDTEVILRLFEREGIQCLTKLNGMFSVCLWDDAAKEVFIARDQLGIKPLYVYEDASLLAFASELKAITALPGLYLFYESAAPRCRYISSCSRWICNAETFFRAFVCAATDGIVRRGRG
jgi:asparagine synthase (glutamine-hydrolysing)